MLTVDVLGVCKALYKLQLQHCSLRGRSRLDAEISIKMGWRSAAHEICPCQSILSQQDHISQAMPCSRLTSFTEGTSNRGLQLLCATMVNVCAGQVSINLAT